MKKILTMLTAAVAAIALCVCLAACGNNDSSVAGTYKYYGTIVHGETHYVTDEDMDVTEDYIIITLNPDGTGTQQMTFSENNTVTANFTWTLDGTSLKLISEVRTAECKLEGEIIYFDIGDNVNTLLIKKVA